MAFELSRRRLLQVGGALGIGTLAGCGDMLGSESTATPDGETTAISDSETDTPGGETTAISDGTTTDTPDSGATDTSTGAIAETAAWRMRGYGPKNQGFHPSAAGPGENLETRWTQSASAIAEAAGVDMEYPTISHPIITNGSVFVALWDAHRKSELYCCRLDGEGAIEWTTGPIVAEYSRVPDRNGPTAAVVDETVVFTVASYDGDLSLVALDISSGSIKWEAEGGAWTPPTIHDGEIVVGGDSDTAQAFRMDGSPAWNYRATSPERGRLSPNEYALAVTDSRVYVSTLGEVHSLDRSGNRQWRTEITRRDPVSGGPTQSSGAVVGEYVYVATSAIQNHGDGWLLALDPSDGSVAWEFQPAFDEQQRQSLLDEREHYMSGVPLNASIYGTPVLADDTLVIGGYTFPGDVAEGAAPFLFGLDPASGDRNWSTQLPGDIGLRRAVAADGTVYLPIESADDNSILAVDPASGSIQASFDAVGFADGLAVAGESLFAREEKQTIRAMGPA